MEPIFPAVSVTSATPAGPTGATDPGWDAPAPGNALERAMAALTGPQRQAVESAAPALCIVAGAGSGKTRVLTLRVARRIRDGSADADHTAVCTFTRKAARELKERLGTYGVPVSSPASAGRAPGPGVRAGTLHQLALTLLKRHALDGGEPPPVVAEHRYRIIRDLAGDPAMASVAETEIGWAKARCLSADGYVEAAADAGRTTIVDPERIADLFADYDRALVHRRSLDLDDVLVRSGDLLLGDADFAERMHWRYRHLSVDEFQDVNPAQFRLIHALAGSRRDLCAVGDPNQAIYGWNGADPTLLDRLPETMGDMAVVRLDENHRSTPQVVAAATACLGRAVTVPPRSSAEDGPMPVVTAFEDETAEAEGIVSSILEGAEDGMPFSDRAVLARTHDQLSQIGKALERAGVPYRVAPGPESPAGESPGGWTQGDRPNRADLGQQAPDAVELATFHRAKGLEWMSVYVVGVEDGFVPIVYATSEASRDEERRLLYVALTRASRELHCSWARVRRMGNGRQMERQPSPWLASVARVSRTGSGRITPRDAGRHIAAMRASLGR